MNFHVSRRYNDLPSDIITRGCREKDVREAWRGRVAEVSTGTRSAGERFAKAGGRRTGAIYFIEC